MAALHPEDVEDVLVVEVGEEEREELTTGSLAPVSVVEAVEEEERRREEREADMEYAIWWYDMEELKKALPGYDEKLGLVQHFSQAQNKYTDKYQEPKTKEGQKKVFDFWVRHEFPEGLVEAAQRSGVEAKKMQGLTEEEKEEEQRWTRQLWYYRVSRELRLLKTKPKFIKMDTDIQIQIYVVSGYILRYRKPTRRFSRVRVRRRS